MHKNIFCKDLGFQEKYQKPFQRNRHLYLYQDSVLDQAHKL